ncbi:MAG: hypothetical protein FWH18_00840 [Marinilabiliaceae bacterium]|nr:hypothetical protein [Marinilabiliaceae bacterium]
MKHCFNIGIYWTFGLLFLNSCFNKPKNLPSENISEGEILYKITYNQEVETNSMSFVYPKEMTLYFKDNKQRLSYAGALGLYSFDFIFGDEHDTVYTLLKINLLDMRVYIPTINENLLIFSKLSNEVITELSDETKEIAGIIAKKAVVKLAENDSYNISVWYSDDFKISSPNKNTPLHNVPGIPLESEITYKNVTFSYQAYKINSIKIEDDIFKVPYDYNVISLSEMEELLNMVF